MRATISTALHEIGYPKAWIDAQLSHTDPDKVSASYNHAEYVEQRRHMMQDWADRLDLWEQGREEAASSRLVVRIGVTVSSGDGTAASGEEGDDVATVISSTVAPMTMPVSRLSAVPCKPEPEPEPEPVGCAGGGCRRRVGSGWCLFPLEQGKHVEPRMMGWAGCPLAFSDRAFPLASLLLPLPDPLAFTLLDMGPSLHRRHHQCGMGRFRYSDGRRGPTLRLAQKCFEGMGLRCAVVRALARIASSSRGAFCWKQQGACSRVSPAALAQSRNLERPVPGTRLASVAGFAS